MECVQNQNQIHKISVFSHVRNAGKEQREKFFSQDAPNKITGNKTLLQWMMTRYPHEDLVAILEELKELVSEEILEKLLIAQNNEKINFMHQYIFDRKYIKRMVVDFYSYHQKDQ